eukprot:1176739-Prorocentrum_minimum.AAC.1
MCRPQQQPSGRATDEIKQNKIILDNTRRVLQRVLRLKVRVLVRVFSLTPGPHTSVKKAFTEVFVDTGGPGVSDTGSVSVRGVSDTSRPGVNDTTTTTSSTTTTTTSSNNNNNIIKIMINNKRGCTAGAGAEVRGDERGGGGERQAGGGDLADGPGGGRVPRPHAAAVP